MDGHYIPNFQMEFITMHLVSLFNALIQFQNS